jgi:hypothetical protein
MDGITMELIYQCGSQAIYTFLTSTLGLTREGPIPPLALSIIQMLCTPNLPQSLNTLGADLILSVGELQSLHNWRPLTL